MIAIAMVTVDMDCHISAVCGRKVIAIVMMMVDMDCHISAVWNRRVAVCLRV